MAAPPNEQLVQLVSDLVNGQTRENALLELSKKRESFPDLAPYLWHSFGTMAALLQEIITIYPSLSPPSLTAHASNRVCNALALLQCVASHPDTRALFLQGTAVFHVEKGQDEGSWCHVGNCLGCILRPRHFRLQEQIRCRLVVVVEHSFWHVSSMGMLAFHQADVREPDVSLRA